MRRVAITGVGAVTPLGLDAPSTWRSLVSGRSGIGDLDSFDSTTFPVRIAGMVKGFDPEKLQLSRRELRHLSKAAQYGVAAAQEAIRDAGAGWGGADPYSRGVCVGATVGRPDLQEVIDMSQLMLTSDDHQHLRQSPSRVLLRDQSVGTAAIAGVGECAGPVISVSTACAGAAHAIGEAYRRVQSGECDGMLTGGFDSLTTWVDVLGFSLLGALNEHANDDPEHASRPFDGHRAGFVLGEGAVMFALEDFETAIRRNARIHAELVGYGSSLNAYRITDSPPDGAGASHAMRAALADADIPPDRIDYIVAHGTGTHGNDVSETRAIKSVFGEAGRTLSISSPKSTTGHLTSASAGLNLLAAIGAIRHSMIPPTMNLDNPDPALDLDYTPLLARPRPVHYAMVNAFAFGGANACLVVSQPTDPSHHQGLS